MSQISNVKSHTNGNSRKSAGSNISNSTWLQIHLYNTSKSQTSLNQNSIAAQQTLTEPEPMTKCASMPPGFLANQISNTNRKNLLNNNGYSASNSQSSNSSYLSSVSGSKNDFSAGSFYHNMHLESSRNNGTSSNSLNSSSGNRKFSMSLNYDSQVSSLTSPSAAVSSVPFNYSKKKRYQ